MDNKESIIDLYNALITCSETVTNSKTEDEIFSKMCPSIVNNVRSIKMGWIGIHDQQTNTIVSKFRAGDGSEYVTDISIDLNDVSLSNGPTGIAFKTGEPYWCNDFLHDPHTAPWHETAKKYGWKASAAVPLKKNNDVIGIVNLYSRDINIFTHEIQHLIQRMVIHVNNTITNLENDLQRKKVEEELQDSYNILNTIIDSLPTRIFWKDKNLTYLGCNSVFANDAGKSSPNEIVGKNDHQMTWKDQADLYNADDMNVITTQKAKLFFEEPQTTPDGKTIWLRTSKVPLRNSHNEVIGILGMYDDITEQKNLQSELQKSTEQLNAIIENEPACVKLVNKKGELVSMNPAGLAMLEGDSLKEINEHPLVSYILPKWREPFLALHKKVMQGENASLEFEVKGLKGGRKWLETYAVPMYDENHNINMLLGLTRDITEKKASQERILYMANYDDLTQLPNRANLTQKLEYIIPISQRNNEKFALMFLDIDNFKDINDTLGHNIGDKLLIKLAQRLTSILREEDTLARLGGDEFVMLFPSTNAQAAEQIAKKILISIYEPFDIEQHELTVTISIGIALYPNDGKAKEILYRNADSAMYRAKHNGKNNYAFFTDEMQKSSQRNLLLHTALHQAIRRKELSLVYQPQIDTNTEKLLGAEALLRWKHPELGNISPEEFIPIAESSGLILSIGEWVMKTALTQCKKWIDKGLETFTISVNLSAVQFNQTNLYKHIDELLKNSAVPAKYLELEITESALMNNAQATINLIEKLHKLGLKIAIDDFGTGYSSLSYLKKFKAYKLKIDQSFVRDISTDPEDKAIIDAIINMSQSLGLRTIAEGVETEEQLQYLREKGCDEIQGYYYAKPLTNEEFENRYINISKK